MSTIRQKKSCFVLYNILDKNSKFNESLDREDMCNSLTAGAQNSITQTAIKLGYYTSTINGKDL